mmetsp:Transcript_35005/g.62952  ORF Transcript_35005/g.62952 Transcript_35005/m.62952 type:complete len:369 (-) Transcript_35005:266-1372(-)|eukprot:CAMPEP_0175052074 /NCGR_PEP_ID=MMETSP0052_2-20121109/8159_1 /TAXON_ID=51329 ORGANISM="Polytomella parva, Strain SAG 63-3" /NCGR_SAMPLE_ID=MMETSP0052_2 /ASSEMBLY_ACC=CAM_ASM_000194 /LENGTH=368 /DNA_ID=CAMNT_0016316441 /DNA_START=93 /DNA_END=1199 /DNA_ORIENTATION=-
MVFWFVSLPLVKNRKDATWELLQEKSSNFSTNWKLEVPELRVGTLDLLMALSDDLSKTSNMMDVVVSKIRRQLSDVAGPAAVQELKVDGLPTDAFLKRFRWDESKFPIRRPLKESVEKISEIVSHIEDDMKVKVSDYNNLKTQLSTVVRKATGSLSVRDISTTVKPDQVVNSENLVSLFCVISKFSLKEWETSYETMSKFVVPRSSKVVAEDQDSFLVSVVLFRRSLDEFKSAARSRGFQVREYVPVEGDSNGPSSESLKQEVEQRKGALEQWCKTAYGETFSCYIHVAIVRLFVESILRYGLPPAFQAAILRPGEKNEAKLRDALSKNFGDGKANLWKEEEGNNVGLGLAGDGEMFPYVSLTINTDM